MNVYHIIRSGCHPGRSGGACPAMLPAVRQDRRWTDEKHVFIARVGDAAWRWFGDRGVPLRGLYRACSRWPCYDQGGYHDREGRSFHGQARRPRPYEDGWGDGWTQRCLRKQRRHESLTHDALHHTIGA